MFWYKSIGFRPVEEQDLEDIRSLRNEPSTWSQLTAIGQISQEQQKAWFEKVKRSNDCAYFSVFKEVKDFPISTTGDFLGIIRFDQMDSVNRSIRVGCDIVPGERGKGYGTMVFEAILEFCFNQWNMHRLWLCVLEDNEIALKLYANAGFQPEGKMRQAIWRNGIWKDYVIMSILENEYRGQDAL